MADLSAFRDSYRQEKQALWANIANSAANGRGLKRSLMRLATLADKLLIQLWNQAGFDNGESLIAVGGFGRGELFPSSDLDVLVLLPDHANPDASEELKTKLENFIGSCWDSGLEIGSSVRTLKDCLEESAKDITVQTSLLESRYITGSKSLFAKFQSSYQGAMDPHAFLWPSHWNFSSATTNLKTRPILLSPIAKNHQVVCAICKSSCGLHGLLAWEALGTIWQSKVWPPL